MPLDRKPLLGYVETIELILGVTYNINYSVLKDAQIYSQWSRTPFRQCRTQYCELGKPMIIFLMVSYLLFNSLLTNTLI